jgi:outer membrane protein OmpA-like peptidoglycan-associated protein
MKNLKNFLLGSFFFLLCLEAYSRQVNGFYTENAKIKPEKLTLFADSVRFSLKGTIPIISGLIPRNPRLRLVLKSQNNQKDFGELILKKNVSTYSYDQSFVFLYQPWMEESHLELQFFQGSRKNEEPEEKKILANGIVTTPLLMKKELGNKRNGVFESGMLISNALAGSSKEENQKFEFFFRPGSSLFESTEANQKALHNLDQFLAKNSSISKVKIIGIQSPEFSEGRNSKLGMDRALSIRTVLQKRGFDVDDNLIQLDSRSNNWVDFREQIDLHPKLTSDQKKEYQAVLDSGLDFLDQNLRLKKIQGFDEISKELFPKLRVARLEIQGSQIWGLDPIKLKMLKEILSDQVGINTLEKIDWEIAGQSAETLDEKHLIYSKMLSFFKSSSSLNNLAVVKMRQAQTKTSQVEKEKLLEEADFLLSEALKIENNPLVLYNQAIIFIEKGENWEAYRKLSTASNLSRDLEFLVENENLKGFLDVLRGDYKLARIRYNYPSTDPVFLFNKGIAHFLAEDLATASIAFEESILADREFGFGYYGLALVAARSGLDEIAWIHLQNAINSNEQIHHRAKFDPMMEEVRKKNPLFF